MHDIITLLWNRLLCLLWNLRIRNRFQTKSRDQVDDGNNQSHLSNSQHILNVLIFACIYFRELKKRISQALIFAIDKFLKILRILLLLRMTSFWKFFEKFEFINFRLKERKIRKESWIKWAFSGFCQDQRKDSQVKMKKLLLLIASTKKLN